MLPRKLCFGLAALIALAQLSQCDAVVAQRPSAHTYRPVYGSTHVFPRSSTASKTLSQAKRSSQFRGSSAYRGNSFNRGLKPQQFNQRSVYSPKSRSSSNFKRYSPSYNRSFFPVTSFNFGYQAPYYDPFLSYGRSYSGFRSSFPSYATYGTFLNVGGVGGPNPNGSSAAAEALQRLANQQPVVPPGQNVNSAQEAEILRLQIELEKARQQLALQNQAQPQAPIAQAPAAPIQRTLKPAVADNQQVIDQLGLAAIIETNELAAASQLKAERAFRSGDYGKAARFVGLATSLDESNGKLMLFASQAHFANQEYAEAVAALKSATALLEAEDLGFVIQNFKLFYGRNDFVSQITQLSNRLKQSPSDADAWLLRGYQYGALGYPDAARKDLEKAKSLGSSIGLTDSLLSRFTAEDLNAVADLER